MATIKVDGFDLWNYTRVAAGDGLDIADNDFLDPQFSDSAAGFGDPLINVQAKNRELVVPVHLKAVSKDALHQLVSDLNRRLSVAKQLEWKDDGATNSSWLKIQFARFEPEFNKRRQDAGWMSGTVRIYTEPYAKSVSSGYTYSIGSFAGTGIMASFSIASYVVGDAPITTRFTINTPSVYNRTAHGRILAGAVLPASYIADWPAASIVPMGSTTLIGASGAVGSQTLAHIAHGGLGFNGTYAASGWSGGNVGQIVLTVASAYTGNNRVLAVVTANYELDVFMANRDGTPPYVRSVASQMPNMGESTVDLGVIKVDPASNGATHTIIIGTSRRNFTYNHTLYSANATGVFELNRVILLPEDTMFMVVDDSRRQRLSLIEGQKVATTTAVTIDAYGQAVGPSGFPYEGATSYGTYMFHSNGLLGNDGSNLVNATSADISAQAEFGQTNWSASTYWQIGKKTSVAEYTAQCSVTNASIMSLSIMARGASGVPSVIASVAFNGLSTPSLYLANAYHLRFQQQGPALSAEVVPRVFPATGSTFNPGRNAVQWPTPTLTASVAEAAVPGNPYVRSSMLNVPNWTRLLWTTVPSTGLAPGDVYTISTDERKAIRTNGNIFDVGYGMRGDFLAFPPATKYTAAVAFLLPLDRSEGLNQPWSAAFDFNEQFTYSK
jgi:hypothetical protein